MADHDQISEQSLKHAAQGNDLANLEQLADRARAAIARAGRHDGIQFEGAAAHVHAIAEHDVVSVRHALMDVEARIAHLREEHLPKRAAPPPRVDPDAPPASAVPKPG